MNYAVPNQGKAKKKNTRRNIPPDLLLKSVVKIKHLFMIVSKLSTSRHAKLDQITYSVILHQDGGLKS